MLIRITPMKNDVKWNLALRLMEKACHDGKRPPRHRNPRLSGGPKGSSEKAPGVDEENHISVTPV
jgi:hypothetical protein